MVDYKIEEWKERNSKRPRQKKGRLKSKILIKDGDHRRSIAYIGNSLIIINVIDIVLPIIKNIFGKMPGFNSEIFMQLPLI